MPRRPQFYQYGDVIRLINVVSPRVEELLSADELDEFNLRKERLGRQIAEDENVPFRADLPSVANLTVLSPQARRIARWIKRWLIKNDIPLTA